MKRDTLTQWGEAILCTDFLPEFSGRHIWLKEHPQLIEGGGDVLCHQLRSSEAMQDHWWLTDLNSSHYSTELSPGGLFRLVAKGPHPYLGWRLCFVQREHKGHIFLQTSLRHGEYFSKIPSRVPPLRYPCLECSNLYRWEPIAIRNFAIVAQLLICVWLFGTLWTIARLTSLSSTVSWSLRRLRQWCHPIISFSVVPFSSRFPSFPASGSFPVSWFFASGGRNIGASASASVLPMNIQH